MKYYYLFFISFLLAHQLKAQIPEHFYFTIASPSSIYQSLAPGEYGTVGTGWGWDGTITNDFFAEMVYASEDFSGHYLCEADASDYTGKVVLVDRGLCDFSEKAFNAQNQGALAVVIRNFDEDLLHMAPGLFSTDVTIPCIMISASVGDNLIFELLSGSSVIVGFSNTPHPILQKSGTVVRDENLDCINTPGETNLSGWKIYTHGSNGFSGINYTDADGHYQLFVDTGTYEINLMAPNSIWQVCPPVIVSSFTYDSIQVDLQAQVLVDCPEMSVDIEAPLLRRCFDNNEFTVNYCNLGSAIAESAYVTIQFDDFISIVSSSLAYTVLSDNTYEFLLGDIESNECGSFTITTFVSCEVELQQTICAFANIYPQMNCETGGGTYNGPVIKVKGNCTGNEVVFQIENTGVGDMDAPTSYTVFRNDKILETASLQLMAGKTNDYHFSADGATYRVEAEQPAVYPEESSPSFTVEACTSGTGNFDTGFFNMFPPADYGAEYDEICIQVIGSFDPNDKTPTPLGYGDKHFIEKNTDVHYSVRFQNTGTDTAFNIIVRDTLSGAFDISSLELGASSHDYAFRLLESNVLEFKFINILLPDSNINEAASHGFFTYQLKQNEQLDLGTVIPNSAAIYFDYNEAVMTNETFHTIGADFIGTVGVTILYNNISLQVYPNPMEGYVIFKIQNIGFQEGRLELYDSKGQLVRVEKILEATSEIKRKDLPTGSYFYKLSLDDKLSATGLIQVLESGH
ncbi:MAG TPA: PA domain-containing protein [Saprospiraceae bacterium]|nr:PA domain-containing protein [Saprospiraceae bacterium]